MENISLILIAIVAFLQVIVLINLAKIGNRLKDLPSRNNRRDKRPQHRNQKRSGEQGSEKNGNKPNNSNRNRNNRNRNNRNRNNGAVNGETKNSDNSRKKVEAPAKIASAGPSLRDLNQKLKDTTPVVEKKERSERPKQERSNSNRRPRVATSKSAVPQSNKPSTDAKPERPANVPVERKSVEQTSAPVKTEAPATVKAERPSVPTEAPKPVVKEEVKREPVSETVSSSTISYGRR